MNTDLTKLLNGLEGKWVALSADNSRVVGTGDNPGEAIKQAHTNKEENPILTKVPETSGGLIV